MEEERFITNELGTNVREKIQSANADDNGVKQQCSVIISTVSIFIFTINKENSVNRICTVFF